MALAAALISMGSLAAEPPLSAAQLDWVAAEQLPTEAAARLAPFCTGAYLEPSVSGDPQDTEINATAESAVHLFEQSSTLQGAVEITRGDTLITAPFVRIDEASKLATIEGPLIIRRPGFLMTGAHATSNLLDNTGQVEDATFLLHRANLRGSADRLRQDSDQVVTIADGTLTRCDPGSNTWSLRGQQFVLDTQAGFGVAKDVTLAIKEVPVMYLPWLRFPINDARQSGFLLPNIGSGGINGTDINIPYYFNLAPNRDATYQLRSLTRRGLVHDGQFRYLTPGTRNEINAGYINRDKIFDQRSLQAEATDTEFEARSRWYIDLRHQGGQASRWQTAVNYSAVSDVDYLTDIGADVGAASSQPFMTPIDLNQANRRSPGLDQLAQTLYRGKDWLASVTVRDFQNLDIFDPEQYAILPMLAREHTARSGRWQLASRLEYAHFDKSDGPLGIDPNDPKGLLRITGERTTAALDLSHPYRQRWGFVTPGLKLTHRQYQLDNTQTDVDQRPRLTTRTFYLDAGLIFTRPIKIGNTALEQTLEPRLFYLYTGEQDQQALPLFDVSTLTPGYAQLFRTNRFTGG
ncbi:MAG: LPS-assembly protein LptD, partial [SAR86 cluster bacterium]|nr:LPS-assembly protein LptD [SAR86 cluster bacterium]